MNALLRIVWCVAFALAVPAVARAADPPRPARRIAVIIGANEPAPGRQPLRYSHADAQLLADTLVRVGHFAKTDVRVLLEPRPGEVLGALDSASRELQAAPSDSLLLFYYSGHSDGQYVFPHGERLPLVDLRDRLGRSSARVRIAIVDTCRGGSWTRAKGLTVGPALDEIDLMNVATEGTALLSSSSGMESAHEAGSIKGSFFTHHLNAGLLGAADASGDGAVTLQEAFVYARERTVRDSARMAATTQHPSFDMQLRGRQDIVLAQTRSSKSALLVKQKNALEIIHLGSGATVVETPSGAAELRIALVPGRYVIRRVEGGKVQSKEITIGPDTTVTVDEAQLESSSGDQLAMKSAEEAGEAPCKDDCDCPKKERTDLEKVFGGDKPCPKDDRMWEKTNVVGLRGSLTHTDGAETDGTFGAAMAQVASEQFKTAGLVSAHASMNLSLGGGSAGLEGGLGGMLTGGIRLPVGEHHGPVARIGAGGELFGNRRFYFSRIALPVAQLGYQYIRDRTVLEAGARGAAILTGRYNTGHRTNRELGDGSIEWGGYLALHHRLGRLDANVTRIEAGDNFPGGAVHVFRSWACGHVLDKIAICADGMLVEGDASFGPRIPTNVVSFYGGLTVGALEF